jgi:septal ring factor EnvC (AmiA/AmiB activator)
LSKELSDLDFLIKQRRGELREVSAEWQTVIHQVKQLEYKLAELKSEIAYGQNKLVQIAKDILTLKRK